MGGIADTLFGSEKEAHTRKTQRLTPEQMDLLKKLSDQIKGQIGQGVQPYPGQMVAKPSGLQQGLFDILSQQVGGQGGALKQTLQTGTNMLPQEQNIPSYQQFNANLPITSNDLEIPKIPNYQQFNANLPNFEKTNFDNYNPEADKNYWEQAFVQPAKQQFQQEILPQLREKFAGQNALSSGGFNRAVANAAGNLNTQLGSKLADILYQSKQDYLNNQLNQAQYNLQRQTQAGQQALQKQQMLGNLGLQGAQLGTQQQQQLANQLLQNQQTLGNLANQFARTQQSQGQLGLTTLDQALNEINALQQGGKTQRSITQGGLNEALKKWQYGRPYNNPWLKQTPTALSVNPYKIDTYTTGGGSGLLGGIMGGVGEGIGNWLGPHEADSVSGLGKIASTAGSIASIASMFSDIRLKTNIRRTGHNFSGCPVVIFKWDKSKLSGADDQDHIGIIAQDLQAVRPDLVGEQNGYLTVNYKQLLREVNYYDSY